jgi:polyferredoxin
VLSPGATLFGYLYYMLTWKSSVLLHAGMIGWLKLLVLLLALAPSLFFSRFFCRFICPMGALLEPLSKFKVSQCRE